MKTTLERRGEKQIPPFSRNDKGAGRNDKGAGRNDKLDLWNEKRDLWAPVCGTAGAAVWAGIAVLARVGVERLGAIELLFLFGPLVIVPLGMELGRALGFGGRLQGLAQRLQPAGAALAVVAMWLPPGRRAGVAALGWMMVCALMAGGGLERIILSLREKSTGESPVPSPAVSRRIVPTRVGEIAAGIACLDLAVGGAWLVASRWGARPMGIQEPIGLLTAVHFHFAGFATAMIAAAMLRSAENRRKDTWLKALVLMVAGLPFVIAAGFVSSPIVKMAAAVLFSASVAGVAIVLRGCGRRAKDATARILLQVAAGAVFAGMVLSGAYAVADFLGSEVLTVPQMARTHGVLNSVGFCLPGLLGWLVESSAGSAGQRRTSSFSRRSRLNFFNKLREERGAGI